MRPARWSTLPVTPAALAVTAAVLLLAAPAAHAQLVPERGTSDNVAVLAHVAYPQSTDLHFQRRAGRQHLDGRVVDEIRDYLFAGADASAIAGAPPPGGVGIRILDVTDPAAPVEVAAVACTGYHADVAVYENLLVQTIDAPDTNRGCADELDPDGLDRSGVAGLRVLDVTDPARPRVAGFVEQGVHNVTVVPWAGLAYLSIQSLGAPEPLFGFVDLTDPALPATTVPMREISATATDGCHDIGLDPQRKLAFCAAVTQTFVWDISDPRAPREVAAITNPLVTIHHGARLAPDGRTLVLNDELAGGAVSPGCLGTGEVGLVGALWFYDLTDAASPALRGSFSTAELDPLETPCTSHFYNFVPGTTLLAVGWYRSGAIVVDYADPAAPREHAAFAPEQGNFWTAYYWRGAVYGSSFGESGGGLWVVAVDGLPDAEPAAADEGTSWARWTSQVPAPGGVTATPAPPTGGSEETAEVLPATGGGAPVAALVLLLASAASVPASVRIATGRGRMGRAHNLP